MIEDGVKKQNNKKLIYLNIYYQFVKEIYQYHLCIQSCDSKSFFGGCMYIID